MPIKYRLPPGDGQPRHSTTLDEPRPDGDATAKAAALAIAIARLECLIFRMRHGLPIPTDCLKVDSHE